LCQAAEATAVKSLVTFKRQMEALVEEPVSKKAKPDPEETTIDGNYDDDDDNASADGAALVQTNTTVPYGTSTLSEGSDDDNDNDYYYNYDDADESAFVFNRPCTSAEASDGDELDDQETIHREFYRGALPEENDDDTAFREALAKCVRGGGVGGAGGRVSEHKGVTFEASRNQWKAQCWVNGRTKFIGRSNTEEGAHQLYKSHAANLAKK